MAGRILQAHKPAEAEVAQGIRNAFFALLLLVLMTGFAEAEKKAGEEDKGALSVEGKEEEYSLAKVWQIVRRGHVYLAGTQNPDGSFSVDRNSHGDTSAPIAVTALTCLSFMAGGNTPSCGPFRTQLKKGLNYLVEVCDPETGVFHDDLDDTSKMHGQGFAILALAQAYGMFGLDDRSMDRARLEQALRKSVELVCMIQTEVGGWYYDTTFSSEHEGSITICIVQALRAARNAGVHVNKNVIDRAVNYVRRSQKKSDGSFRYRLNDDNTSYALTAAAVATLNATGEYDSDAIDLAMEYMQKKDPILNIVTFQPYPHYSRFYAAQAYWQYKNLSIWNRWFPRLVAEFKGSQYPNGSFGNSKYGSVYATAMNTLTLQVPFGYLPIFQR